MQTATEETVYTPEIEHKNNKKKWIAGILGVICLVLGIVIFFFVAESSGENYDT